jgi:hypothetical protein
MVVVGDEFNLPVASRLVKSITTPTYHEADELLPPEGRFTPDTQQLLKIYKNCYEKFTAIEVTRCCFQRRSFKFFFESSNYINDSLKNLIQ